jgi:hypothetical protein
VAERPPQLEQEPAVLEQRAPARAPPLLVQMVVQEPAQQPVREHQHAAERRLVEVDRS